MGEIDAGGKGNESESKTFEEAPGGASSMQWRCQQEVRQMNPEAQGQEDYGRFPAKQICESSSDCSVFFWK